MSCCLFAELGHVYWHPSSDGGPKPTAVPRWGLTCAEQKRQSLPFPDSWGHVLLTPPQVLLALIAAQGYSWPQLSLLPASAQGHPPEVLPVSTSPSLQPCRALTSKDRAWPLPMLDFMESYQALPPSCLPLPHTQIGTLWKLDMHALYPLLSITGSNIEEDSSQDRPCGTLLVTHLQVEHNPLTGPSEPKYPAGFYPSSCNCTHSGCNIPIWTEEHCVVIFIKLNKVNYMRCSIFVHKSSQFILEGNLVD